MGKILGLSLVMMSSLAFADLTPSPYNKLSPSEVRILPSEVRTAISHSIIALLSDLDYANANCEVQSPKENFIPLGENDAVMMITLVGCEGGNHYETYLTYVRESDSWKRVNTILIGTDREFVAQSIFLLDNTLIIKGLEWSNRDAHCCPSIPAIKQFQVTNKQEFIQK